MSRPARVALPMLVALVELIPTLSPAQETRSPVPAQQVTPELVRSKETMVRRLLTDSPVAHRIGLSNSAEAKSLLGHALDQYGTASAALKAGELARANDALNDALWTVGKARQLVPDEADRRVEQKVRYSRLLESSETLRTSYVRHSARGGNAAAERDLAQIDSLMSEGKNLANIEELTEAIRSLERAEQLLMAGINRTLGATTLEYAEKFDSPAEEFAYELDRNRSFADLVPLAVADLRPGEDAKRLIDRYVEQNRGLREQAQATSKSKDFATAIRTLKTGTGYLQRALLAAGLVIPQQEAKPE